MNNQKYNRLSDEHDVILLSDNYSDNSKSTSSQSEDSQPDVSHPSDNVSQQVETSDTPQHDTIALQNIRDDIIQLSNNQEDCQRNQNIALALCIAFWFMVILGLILFGASGYKKSN